MDDRWYAGDRMISTLNNSFLTIQGRGDGTVSEEEEEGGVEQSVRVYF